MLETKTEQVNYYAETMNEAEALAVLHQDVVVILK